MPQPQHPLHHSHRVGVGERAGEEPQGHDAVGPDDEVLGLLLVGELHHVLLLDLDALPGLV